MSSFKRVLGKIVIKMFTDARNIILKVSQIQNMFVWSGIFLFVWGSMFFGGGGFFVGVCSVLFLILRSLLLEVVFALIFLN